MLPERGHEEILRRNRLFMRRDYWGQLIEDVTLDLYSAVLTDGAVAIDCGGHTGEHTLKMAFYCGPSGTVISIEPVPELMEQNKRRNAGYVNRIRFVEKAVLRNLGGTVSFLYFPNEPGLSSVKPRTGVSVTHELDVEATTIDAEAAGLDVDLIKLDIEGAEFEALQGARETLRRCAPLLVIEHGGQETADRFSYTSEQFFGFFDELGYLLFYISGSPYLPSTWSAIAPWQLVAIHRSSPKIAPALATMESHFTRAVLAYGNSIPI